MSSVKLYFTPTKILLPLLLLLHRHRLRQIPRPHSSAAALRRTSYQIAEIFRTCIEQKYTLAGKSFARYEIDPEEVSTQKREEPEKEASFPGSSPLPGL